MAKNDIHFVYITMDGGHNAALREAAAHLKQEYDIHMHLALHSMPNLRTQQDWARLEADVQAADFTFGCMIFGEEHVRPMERILDSVQTPMVFITSNPALIYRTHLGKLSLKPAPEGEEQGMLKRWMQRLRPKKSGKAEGHRQTQFIKNLTKYMKYMPGMMRDLHTFIAMHDYWIHSSPENLRRQMLLLIERYVPGYKGKLPVQDPIEYPDLAIYHPDAPNIFPDAASYRAWRSERGMPISNGKPGAFAGSVGLLTMRAIILSGNTQHLDALIRGIEAQGMEARAVYSAMLDFRPAVETFLSGSQGDLHKVDAVLNTMGFPLVGGPAGTRPEQAVDALSKLDVAYLDMIPLGFQRVEDWQADEIGLNPMQTAMNIALPELDSATEPVIFGGPTLSGDKFVPLHDEQAQTARRIGRRVQLRAKRNADKKIAIVLFNFPPNLGNAGTAAFLDVFASVHRLLAEMRDAGYNVDVPDSPEALRHLVVERSAQQYGTPGSVADLLPVERYRQFFPWYSEIEPYWGYAPGELLTNGKAFYILGAQLGSVFVGIQPSFGYERDPMRLLMGKDAAPNHGFAAFYAWLNHVYRADAVVHFGTHGALEFMPGKQVGISANCWSARLIGDLPNFYYYCVNNPSEGTIARRRSAATLVSYMVPPMQQAGLYKGLRRLKDTLDQYHKRLDANLLADIRQQAAQLNIAVAADSDAAYAAGLGHELLQIESRMIPLGLHILGKAPEEAELVDMLALISQFNPIPAPTGDGRLPTLPALIAQGFGWNYQAIQDGVKSDVTAQERHAQIDSIVRQAMTLFVRASRSPALDTSAIDRCLLDNGAIRPGTLTRFWAWLDGILYRIQHDQEVAGMLHALNGGYIQPSPGNDVVRNEHIVPTGRNIHALDPYRVPTPAALSAASKLVDSLLKRLTSETGSLPESVAMVLWGTDNLKSDGEGIAQCLALIGARPIEDELGSISDVALIPLSELQRPRIDPVMTISGIFRDLFQHQADLLDKAVRLAAHADEPAEMNYIRKHALAHAAELGIPLDEAAARVYCNASGSYGANVNHMVDGGTWDSDDELSDVFLSRKSFAYRQGQWQPSRAVMERALSTVDAAFQNIDSFELGISDVDHYYEYLGGVSKSVEKLKGERPAVMVADAIAVNDRLSSLEQMIRLETRAKLLNPKWYESMLAHGYEGVREIEARLSNTYGWSATNSAVENWVYDDAAEVFLLDEQMRQRMAQANPHATAAFARRLLEANARGFWDASGDTLDKLREIYVDLEDRLEGVVN